MENISECPTELSEMIISINLLPKDWEKFEKDAQRLTKQFELKIRAAMKKNEISYIGVSAFSQLCPNEVLQFSKKFRQLVGAKLAKRLQSEPEAEGLLNSFFEIRVLYEQNLAFRNIINIFQQFKEFNNPNQTFMLNKPLQTIGFKSDNTLYLVGFRIIEILKSNNVPMERVRECPVCNDIFWVRRIEKKENFVPYCPKKDCGNIFNARKTRIRKLEKEFFKEVKVLRKLHSTLNNENKLITEQETRVIKLREKILQRKQKYGIV